eukprot:scaffold275940_cov33-Tisochrysis_lutea.AAC.2
MESCAVAAVCSPARRLDGCQQARELNDQLRNLSDVRFTDTNRVPHAFQPVVRSKLKLGFIAAESDGPYLIDVDGEQLPFSSLASRHAPPTRCRVTGPSGFCGDHHLSITNCPRP